MNLSNVEFHGRPTPPRRRAHASRSRPESPHSELSHQAPVRASTSAPVPPPGALPSWLLTRAGLDPAAYRGAPLDRRVNACLRALRADVDASARAHIEADPSLQHVALSALLIGVSTFFRDAAVFDAIASGVVASLRERPGPIRVLSVGCSNGAELYSVAMLLADAQLLERAWLLGTDCRADAVARAREGVFRPEDVIDLPPALRARHFDAVRGGWRIAAPLRRRTTWEAADATRTLPAGPWDLVLCRNLVIYLQSDAAARLFRGIAASLAPGGHLVIGKAERPPAGLPLVPAGRCIYRTC